jgi:hypothetical protein
MVIGMKPKQRAKEIADQLDKLEKRKWPALIEAAIQDAENDIIGRLSEKLESQPDPMTPPSAAAMVREMYSFRPETTITDLRNLSTVDKSKPAKTASKRKAGRT